MENAMIEGQKSDEPVDGRSKETLWEGRDGALNERGDYDGHVSASSLYTQASLHPAITGTVAAGALALGGGLAYSLVKRNQEH